MKILLDECIDQRFAQAITGHTVRTVADMGWAGLSNGQLLRKAEDEFDVFMTVDQNLPYQQNLAAFNLPVIVLQAHSIRLADLIPLGPQVMRALPNAVAGRPLVVKVRPA